MTGAVEVVTSGDVFLNVSIALLSVVLAASLVGNAWQQLARERDSDLIDDLCSVIDRSYGAVEVAKQERQRSISLAMVLTKCAVPDKQRAEVQYLMNGGE